MNDKELKKKIKILFSKISRYKTDSIFYDNCGDIAEITDDEGTLFTLISSGDIRINIGNDTYRNNQIDDAISKYKLTDNKIKKLEKDEKLTWENNNWFEIVWRLKDSDFIECEVGDVQFSYDDGIQMLIDYARERGVWKK
jgi:hypothetical protein